MTEPVRLSNPGATVDTLLTTLKNSNLSATHKITRSATIVVAASDSSAKSKAQADYVCDGTNDEIIINAQLELSKNVYLTEGTFTVADAIVVPDSAKLHASGKSTIITAPTGATGPIITTASGATHVTLCNFMIEGTSRTTGRYGIYAYDLHESVVSDIYIHGCRSYGLKLEGVTGAGEAPNWQRNIIGNCHFSECEYGVTLGARSEYNTLHNCCFWGNASGISVIGGNNVIDGCSIVNNTYFGIVFTWGENTHGTVISGNTIKHNGTGIQVSASNDVLIIGNSIGVSTTHAIKITGSAYGSVIGNVIGNDNATTEILLNDATYSNIASNSFYGGSTLYNILETGTCDYNYISSNNLKGAATSPVLTVGSNTKVKGNRGYTTENTGTATITASATTVNVSHGLAAAPTRVLLSPTTATAGKQYYVSAKAATTFTITIDSAAEADISFDWQAVV